MRRVGQAVLCLFLVVGTSPSRADEGDPIIPLEPGGFGGRIGPMRDKLLKEWGGTKETEEAVARGLKWLAGQQKSEGNWKIDGNLPDKEKADDRAATALALLPFLGHGMTHRNDKDNPYAKAVDKGLKFLVTKQNKKTGSFGENGYTNALCTMALCEAYALSKDAALKKPAQLALNHLVSAQHSAGGWEQRFGMAGDMLITGWTVMALESGKFAGLDVPAGTFRKAQNFMDGILQAQTEGYGLVGAQPTPSMSAVGLLCRQYLQGWNAQNPRLIRGIDNYIAPNYPKEFRKEAYFLHQATQVMHHFGGGDWKKWNDKMRDVLVKTQDVGNDAATAGSWPSEGDPSGKSGGRLTVTSLNLMTLEVYYRHVSLSTKKE